MHLIRNLMKDRAMVEFSGAAAFLAVIFSVVTLSGLHDKLDALLIHTRIEYNPYEKLPEYVIQAIQRGEKIQAIKHYRPAIGGRTERG